MLNNFFTDELIDIEKYEGEQIDELSDEYVRKPKTLHRGGYLKIITGCMYAGKTSAVINECRKWESIGLRVLVVNHSLDVRYSSGNKVVSHNKNSIDCVMIDNFAPDFNKQVNKYDVIIVDEAQFFKDLRVNVLHWCDKLKKMVIICGLNGDYQRNKFGEILDLVPDCDDFIRLKALCTKCGDGTSAVFTWKLSQTQNIDNIEVGTDNYTALCRNHYNEAKNQTCEHYVVKKSLTKKMN